MASQLLIKLLSFGFSILIVRDLGANDYGQYAAVLAFGITFAFLSDLGLGTYSVREIARLRDQPDGLARAEVIFGSVLRLRLLLSLGTMILVTAAAWLSGRSLMMVGAVALNSIGLLLYAVQGASDATLSGFERLDITAGARVIYQVVFVGLGGIALLVGLGYYGLILANLAGIAVMAFLCWRGVRKLGLRPIRAELSGWRKLIKLSLPFGVISFALGLSYRFDTLLLNIFRSNAETGYYNAAYNLVFSSVLVSNVINTALYPTLTRQAANDPEQLPRSYARALRYLLALALPIAVGAWALADQIVPFLFTADYLPAIASLRVVIWVVPLMFVSEFLGYVVLISGKEKKAARAVLVSTGANVIINLLLVPRFGLLAASAMTVVTELVLVSQYIWELRGLLRSLNWVDILLRPLPAVMATGATALLLKDTLPLLANIAVCVGVYALMALVLRVIGPDEWAIVRGLVSRVGKAASS